MIYFYVVQSIVSILLIISYFLLVRYTFFLKKATEKYAETTEKLFELNKQSLDLSRDSFDQSRKAFLVNLVSETIAHGITMKIDGKASDWMASYIGGVHEAIKDVDVELAEKFKKAWCLWAKGQWIEIRQMRSYVLKAFGEEEGEVNER